MPPERRRASEACTALTAFWARSMVLSRCSPATCSPAWRESSTSADGGGAHVGQRVAGELLGLGDLAHVGDRLGGAEGLEELVGDPVQRVELEDLQDEDRPGEQRGRRQADHHDLHQRLGVDEHFPRTEVTGVGAADPGGGGVGGGCGVGRRRRGRRRRGRRRSGGGRTSPPAARRQAQRSSAQARRRGLELGWFFSCEASFRQFLLGLARPRTRRDRRAGRLSALDGGGPARTRRRRPRKSKALVATPVPPRFDPISFVGLGSSRFEALKATGRRREPRQVLTALLDLRPRSFGNLKSHRQGGVADRCFATKPRQARRFCNATLQVY